jgi:hypothetical protein
MKIVEIRQVPRIMNKTGKVLLGLQLANKRELALPKEMTKLLTE